MNFQDTDKITLLVDCEHLPENSRAQLEIYGKGIAYHCAEYSSEELRGLRRTLSIVPPLLDKYQIMVRLGTAEDKVERQLDFVLSHDKCELIIEAIQMRDRHTGVIIRKAAKKQPMELEVAWRVSKGVPPDSVQLKIFGRDLQSIVRTVNPVSRKIHHTRIPIKPLRGINGLFHIQVELHCNGVTERRTFLFEVVEDILYYYDPEYHYSINYPIHCKMDCLPSRKRGLALLRITIPTVLRMSAGPRVNVRIFKANNSDLDFEFKKYLQALEKNTSRFDPADSFRAVVFGEREWRSQRCRFFLRGIPQFCEFCCYVEPSSGLFYLLEYRSIPRQFEEYYSIARGIMHSVRLTPPFSGDRDAGGKK